MSLSHPDLIVFFRETIGFHEPEISSCFVPFDSRALRRLRTGDFVWVLRKSLRPDRPESGFERVQICALDRQPEGSLWVVLANESFALDPRRPDERLLRLAAPRRLQQLISEHPLAVAPITP